MGEHIIISQHALNATLERVAEKASHQQWCEQQRQQEHQTRIEDSQRVMAVMEAAIKDPVGLHILARKLVLGESYPAAIAGAANVRVGRLNPDSVRMRSERILRRISDNQ